MNIDESLHTDDSKPLPSKTEPFFENDGILAQELPQYEERPSQQHMASYILDKLSKEENSIIEAGTGIGKSFAYLVPALLHAIHEGKKCALSTETKALQDQLIQNEVPALKKIFKKHFNIDIKAELCLGSGNYLCFRRYEAYRSTGKGGKEAQRAFTVIEKLMGKGRAFSWMDTGIKERLWSRINRDRDLCLRSMCPNFSNCLHNQAKRLWQGADILIMNHYLFFTNINTGKTYLPYTDFVIFDEAHSISDICCKQMGFSINRSFLRNEITFEELRKATFRISVDEIQNSIRDSLVAVENEFEYMFSLLDKILGKLHSYRLKKPILTLNALNEALSRAIDAMGEVTEENADDSVCFLFEGARGRLLRLKSAINSLTSPFEEELVYWIEHPGNPTLRGQPIDSEKIFVEDIISYYSSIICCSATLMAEDSFDFFQKRTSLHDAETLCLESDYNFKNQARIFIPPQNSFILDVAINLIEIANGNTLILFNSYSSLEEYETEIEERLHYSIISQSEYEAFEAVRLFRNEKESVMLGTHSFWQGIDLPGEQLISVIIVKLPFYPPDRPEIEALSEKIEKYGGNPFSELFLPAAILRFRQGFGRLIRSSTDRGIVTILDQRVLTKSYGKAFLNSIPNAPLTRSLEEVDSFLNGEKIKKT